MDIRSHEIIDRRRDLTSENGNNGGAAAGNVSSISNDDNCNGGNNNNNNNTQTLDQVPKSQSQSQLISKSSGVSVRYRECLKNHAASVGGSVHDGCGEFMPSGEEGTIEALRCAACDCHRNFHRKEIDGSDLINHHRSYHHQYGVGSGGGGGGRRLTPPSGMNMMLNPLMLPPPPSYPPLHHHHHHHSHKYGMNSPGGGGGMVTPMSVAYGGGGSGGGGGGGGGAESSSEDLNLYGQSSGEQGGVFQMSKKRFRTKFTMDQKERMMEFAEKLGWRMNKQDEEELKRFCGEIGVKRQVFKVWMHNNKNNAKKHLLPSPPVI